MAVVLSYMVKRGKGPGPFFRWQDGEPLTRARFVMEVKLALTNAGVEARQYAGHSCSKTGCRRCNNLVVRAMEELGQSAVRQNV